jgi:tRNA-specific 2-thiouridylase
MKAKKTVFVGMSGGVDSSVGAALLKKQGYSVVGIFIKIEIGGDCSWRLERRAAFTAAAILDIPLYTIDLSKEYEQAVADYMLEQYRAGRTPNPDVMCNQQIKFGAFYDWAITHGAEYVATGHYAKQSAGQMLIPADKTKDQTYFLYAIDREKLSQILFPLGDLKKEEVRKLAQKFGLANADKPDSQGLCFVGDFDFKKFLREKIGVKKGMVKNEQGAVVGEHDGVYLFTIGERHGFTIHQQASDEKPYYIVAKDLANNILTVSTNPLSGSSDQVGTITLENVNRLTVRDWISHKLYQARLRHRGALTACQVEEKTNGELVVTFTEPVTSPASGQSVVIYDGEVCLGGGIIR